MIVKFPSPDGPALTTTRRTYSKDECEHWNFQVDEHNQRLTCGKCKHELPPMHVLALLAQASQRERWYVANTEQYAQRQASKTIKGAVIVLLQRGVTPGKFAQLADKYKDEVRG